MGLDIVLKKEIGERLLAGVVLMARCAQYQGYNEMFVAGALAMAEYRALGEGLDWPAMIEDVRLSLGTDGRKLIDDALRLGPGRG